MNAPKSNSADPGPLSTEHLNQISDARKRAKKILRAAGMAAFSGWSMAVFAVITLAFAVMSDWSAWAIGFGLAACAANEIRGGMLLKRMEVRGATLLGWNQVFLALLIISYALWSLNSTIKNPGLTSLTQGTGDPQIDAMAKQLTTAVTWGLYGSMVVVGLIVPGLTAVYYFTRGPLVRRFRRETPEWVLEVIRRGG
ncbi:MAG: hypothetical protein KF805_08905 [Phycisphaeraceae bacterium]|nr:hypothetical protein [Phycisphaeraceae bacterium]